MTNVRTLTIAGAALAAMALPAAAQDDIQIGYINKMGDHPWFVAEVAGAREAAEEAGVDFTAQDVQFNADLTITTMDTMISSGVDGIAIVVPDRSLGPVVAEKAEEAGIPLVAVDDDIYFEDDTQVPYVGMNARNIGEAVGRKLAEIYKEEGWGDLPEDQVRIASVEDRKADTCMQRNRGAEAAFLKAVPDFDEERIVRVPYDNPMVSAINNMSTALTANPTVTHWIIYSCNDDGVLGAVRAMENAGYPPENAIGVGIDGSRSCGIFGQGRESGFRGTMYIRSAENGRIAVELLLAAIKEGKELPTTTYVDAVYLSEDNFDQYKAELCEE